MGNLYIRDFQNIVTRARYQEVLKNLHFAENTKQDKTVKDHKIRPIIDHLNELFQAIFSNESEQSIDEHITKFKGRSSMKQYLKIKPMKWEFKWWFRCTRRKCGDAILSKTKSDLFHLVFLTIFLTTQHRLINFFKM